MKFAFHTTDTADPAATEDLEAAAQTFRFVPKFWLVWGICGSGFKEPMQLAAGGVEGTLLLV
jgi:hypothetical protein